MSFESRRVRRLEWVRFGGAAVVAGCMVVATACAPAEPGSGDVATARQAIVNGTTTPTLVALTVGQQLAVGWLHAPGSADEPFCSATLVAPRVVATAEHCVGGSEPGEVMFGVGPNVTAPVASFAVEAIFVHQWVDAALLRLAEDAPARTSGLEPVPVRTTALDETLVGTRGEAAGFGASDDPGPAARRFAALDIVELGDETLTVDGRGERGICFGDSGGPLFAQVGGGPVEVLAVESTGSDTCVDQDEMTRLDALAEWVNTVLAGGTPEFPNTCGDVDYLGRCDGNVATWCDRGRLETLNCADDGAQCGWVDGETGYYCTDDPGQPCGSETYMGRCDGPLLVWCDHGALRRDDCTLESLECAFVDAEIGYNCVETGASSGGSGGSTGGGATGGGATGGGATGGGATGGGATGGGATGGGGGDGGDPLPGSGGDDGTGDGETGGGDGTGGGGCATSRRSHASGAGAWAPLFALGAALGLRRGAPRSTRSARESSGPGPGPSSQPTP